MNVANRARSVKSYLQIYCLEEFIVGGVQQVLLNDFNILDIPRQIIPAFVFGKVINKSPPFLSTDRVNDPAT